MTDDESADDYLERVKADIRADADRARARQPLPRIEPPPFEAQTATRADGIERERLDYAVGDLTGAHYHAFVDQAFRALLKRPPDEVGRAGQMTLLAAGAAKAEILGNLRWSPEGRHVGTRVRGLLSRYLLAKATRLPVIGYGIEWGIALAALPMLMRHQRAADTSVNARFDELDHAQQQTRAMHEQLQMSYAQSNSEHLRSFEDLRARSDALQSQLGQLFARADAIDERVAHAGNERSALARELGELRHHVHVANHWVTSLQRSLDSLENDAAAGSDRGAATQAEDDDGESIARARCNAIWAAEWAGHVPIGALVFDLGSGDGDWLAALAAVGMPGSGIERDPARVAQARMRGLDVAVGDPRASLARIADGAVAALSMDATLATDVGDAHSLLLDARRALAGGGALIVRIEPSPPTSPAREVDGTLRDWTDALARAGFENVRALTGGDGAALFAERS